MPNIGAPELILILLVVLLLFGAKRLPDLSRSVGRSLRILKSETKALHGDDDEQRPASRPVAASELPAPAPAPTTDPTPPVAQPGSPSVSATDRDVR